MLSNKEYAMKFQLVQGDTMLGLHKAVVVDNRDPFGLARVRLWPYGLMGDCNKIPIEAIPWSEPLVPLTGSFTPPNEWSRVLIGFEGGEKYNPVYLGFWYAIPDGTGDLPFDSPTGTEVRPENWHFHDLSPETIMVACSGEGNAMWLEQKFVGQNHLASAINLMDTGGKSVSVKSIHLDTGNYESSFVSISSDKTLTELAENSDPGAITRTGTDTPEQTTGFIELEQQNLKRSMAADSDSFTIDVLEQNDGDGSLSIESYKINGEISVDRTVGSLMAATGDSVYLSAPSNVFINNLIVPPRRYDA